MFIVIFVDENPTELLNLAYSALEGIEDVDVKWMSPAKIKKQYKEYKSTCSFILSGFNGSTYEYLRNLSMKMYGPQLLLDYLRNDGSLLKLDVPLFSTALKDVVVCFSAFNDQNRDSLSEKIEMMHGSVIKDLTMAVNVLVSTNVGTKKVRVAAEKGIPVVLDTWIDYLWKSSAISDPINGLDEEIIAKHRIPIFYNLKICLSGMSALERSEAENVITKNGGEYCRDLTVGHCTHLITKQSSGKKYYYALKWRIQIVTCKWLADSIERGISLDEEPYRLSDKHTPVSGSTPIREEFSNNFLDSECSAISQSGPINETILTNDEKEDDDFDDLDDEDEMDAVETVKMVHKPQSMSSINESDFNNAMDDLDIDNGNVQPAETAIAAPTEMGSLADHGSFDFLSQYFSNEGNVEPAAQSMNVDINDKAEETIKIGDELSLPDESMQITDESLGLFGKCRFTLAALLTREERQMAEKLISENGGTILTGSGNATHTVAPLIDSSPALSRSVGTQLITAWYLQACVKNRSLLGRTTDFLFEPVSLNVEGRTKPLAQTVLSFSGYPSDERKLLKSVASALGASVQDKLARRAIESQKILATTHLVIGKPDRTKLPSCRSWGIPAVSKHWLGACAAAGRLIATQPYEVADSDTSMVSTYTTNTALSTSGTENTEVHPVRVDTEFKSPPPALPLNIRNRHVEKARAVGNEALNISLGDLKSPIMRIAANDPLLAPRKINLAGLEALRTPDHYEPRRAGVSRARRNQLDQSITSPDMRRALESRVKMFERQVAATAPGSTDKKLSMDISLSDMDTRPAARPLHDVVVYVAQSIHSQQIAMKNIIERLGGEFSWIYDSQVTHVICSEFSESARCREELLTASKGGKVLVNCSWLQACDVEQRRVDESIYLVVPDAIVDTSSRKRRGSDDSEVSSAGSSKSARLSESSTRWNYHDKVMSRSRTDESQSTQISDHDMTGAESAADLTEQSAARPVFMLHGVAADACASYKAGIERLGGDIETADTKMSRVTHLVCPEPGRNAKYLSAIAAGLWVLHTSFLDESVAAGRWLDESRYEWGGPCSSQFLDAVKHGKAAPLLDIESGLAEAATRLRQQGGGLAFRDWRVCVLDTPAKAGKIAIIIEAGGGLVLPHEPLPSPDEVTHLLVSKSYLPSMSEQVVKFPCYKVDMISYFLTARNEQESKKIVTKFQISSKEVASLVGSGGGAKPVASRTRRSRRI